MQPFRNRCQTPYRSAARGGAAGPGPTHAEGAVGERFEVLILIGRPAAGKSEVIDFLKKADGHRHTAVRLY